MNDDLKALLDYIGGQTPRGKFAQAIDDEVQRIKNNEEWRREYMTLQMRDRENIEIGKMEILVSQIRRLERTKTATASEFLGVSESFITEVMNIIDENPTLDDKEIAEMLVDF